MTGSHAKAGLWIRKDIEVTSRSAERQFMDRLKDNISLEIIKDEIKNCGAEKRSSLYIVRTLYRFIPELKKKAWYKNIAGLFKHDPNFDYASAVLHSSSDPDWHKKVHTFIKQNMAN